MVLPDVLVGEVAVIGFGGRLRYLRSGWGVFGVGLVRFSEVFRKTPGQGGSVVGFWRMPAATPRAAVQLRWRRLR